MNRVTKDRGFTLMELMVVIIIIVIVAGMTLPAMSGFMKQRRLKGAANIIQSACLETRARAIAQRETQYLLCFAADATISGGTFNGVKGDKSTLYSYDSNTGVVSGVLQLASMERLPEFTSFTKPTANFIIVFYSDGTVEMQETGGTVKNDLSCDLETVTATTDVDIVVEQQSLDTKCLMDVVPNTGRVIFVVK